jgi:hypothetical protein
MVSASLAGDRIGGGALEKIILLLVNILGGAAVIGSYILGLRGESGGAKALWGGVPSGIRPVYTVSMVLSAIGYLAVLYMVLFKLAPGEVAVGGRFGFAIFIPIFLLILVPSALWMPLTNHYVSDPGTGVWIAIRTVLFVVGLASIALAWAFFALKPHNRGVAYWFAVVGSCYFAFHTLVLDAILWAALFRRQS